MQVYDDDAAVVDVYDFDADADSDMVWQGEEEEASTLVFLGWPGQNEPEEDALHPPAALSSPLHSQGSACYQDLNIGSGAISAQMSQNTADKLSNGPLGSKQLM